MIDLAKLAKKLTDKGLMEKPLSNFSIDEISDLIQIIFSTPDDEAVTGYSKPYLRENGELVVPLDVHPAYRWWAKGGMSVNKILEELNDRP